jgi:hypothetical protein
MKFREYLKEAAGKNIKVGSKITWKNDDGDTLSGTVMKMSKDMSGVKVFKIKTKMNNKGKEVLTTWPVGEIMRKATTLKEGEEVKPKCDCDPEEDEVCKICAKNEEDEDEDEEDEDED